MRKIRLGILGTSEIAFRRFLPALMECKEFEYVGVASRDINKTQKFIDSFGGKGFGAYDELLDCEDINAIYIPLPPALHHEWAKKSLERGKHVFLEKPFTTSLNETNDLIEIAKFKDLALHENYMFRYHSQIDYIKELLNEKEIGEPRILRMAFGFPFRGSDDFRYNNALGGGALLDCGGYTIKLASEFLGKTAKIMTSHLNYKPDFDVNIYGSATAINNDGLTAQLSFGMDNNYKCELEIWGSTGTIYTDRILTAPVGFEPTIMIAKGNEVKTKILQEDDTFAKSINMFLNSINDRNCRNSNYDDIIHQSQMVDDFMKGAIQ